MSARKPHRVRYEVLPTSKRDRKADPTLLKWTVSRDKERIATFEKKTDAVQCAVTTARAAWKLREQRSEVVIKRLDGVIQDPRTYGADPRGSEG